jgi:ferrous iron transport protein A
MIIVIFHYNKVRNFVGMIEEQDLVVRLSQLPTGKRAVIKSHEESDFQLTLMEMGCIPGEPVWIEMIAPMGDPLAIQIAGYYLSIRKQKYGSWFRRITR